MPRMTAKQLEGVIAAQAPAPSPMLDYPVRTARVGWLDLEAELPRLNAWVTDHADQVMELAERIRVGTERRVEALRAGDRDALEAIDARLEELRARIGELDYGAKRALVIRALLYLRQLAGPCAVAVSAHGGTVEVSVR